MKAPRVYVTLAVAAGLVAAFFLVPLPVGRVHETGVVVVDPADALAVSLDEPARLADLEPAARPGATVRAGDLLARFKSEALEVELEKTKNEAAEYRRQADDLGQAVRENARAFDDEVLEAYRQQAREVEQRALTADAKVRQLQARKARLAEVRAPRAGVVETAPKKDEVGKLFDRGYTQDRPAFVVGDPTKLLVRVPVDPQHFRTLKEDMPAGGELPATVYVKGRSDREFAGRVVRLPAQNAANVPIQLTQRGGGPLAVKPSEDPNQLVPLAQTYLVEVQLTDPDAAVKPGQLAVVKVHTKWRSAAWWVGQTLANALDFGLYQ